MVQEMTEKELITVTIDNYMNLQRIKQANGDTVNKELDYQLRGLVAKLSSFGVNIEDLTLQKIDLERKSWKDGQQIQSSPKE